MALANSGVQKEVDGMETPNGNFNVYQQQQQQVSQSLINFKCGIDNNSLFHRNNNNESVLSFEAQGVCQEDTYNWDHQRLMDHPNCFQTATNYYSIQKHHKTTTTTAAAAAGGDHHGSSVYEWLYSEPTAVVSDAFHDAQPPHHDIIPNQKRSLSLMGESSGGVCKKQCTAATKKQKPKSSTAKDPQSIAAKNRRERISERLKILQELVPNGSKVDLVTMLEKAISYVKFLQLQVKILATDEFWPVQGGKVPDISQVKEAIDAILSSQRERSSSSNSEK